MGRYLELAKQSTEERAQALFAYPKNVQKDSNIYHNTRDKNPSVEVKTEVSRCEKSELSEKRVGTSAVDALDLGSSAEVFELAYEFFSDREDLPISPTPRGTDPLTHRNTSKTRFF